MIGQSAGTYLADCKSKKQELKNKQNNKILLERIIRNVKFLKDKQWKY